MFTLLFDRHPTERKVHWALEDEFKAAKQAGLDCALIGAAAPHNESTTAILRGFMRTPKEYEQEFSSTKLINNTNQYARCHHAPNYYEFIKEHSPPLMSFLLNSLEDFTDTYIENMYYRVLEFGWPKMIVKDFAKSLGKPTIVSHEMSLDQFSRILRDFHQKRGDLFQGGFVFRRYESLILAGNRPIEYRLWFLGKELIYVNCHSGSDQKHLGYYPPVGIFADLVRHVSFLNSNFFVMDVVLTENGNWIILEMGDGQVSGFPDHEVTKGYPFYRTLANYLKGEQYVACSK